MTGIVQIVEGIEAAAPGTFPAAVQAQEQGPSSTLQNFQNYAHLRHFLLLRQDGTYRNVRFLTAGRRCEW